MDGISIDSKAWTDAIATNSWQVAVLACLIWVLTRRATARRPHLAHALWVLVLIKCLVPPIWCSPIGAFSWLSSAFEPAEPAAVDSPTRIITAEWQVFRFDLDSSPDQNETSKVKLRQNKTSFAQVLSSLLGDRTAWWSLWCLGVVLVAASVVVRLSRLRRRVHQHKVDAPPELSVMVSELAKRLNLTTKVRVWVIDCEIGPAVFGLMRPVILLPRCIIDGKQAEDLKPLVAHELIHVRRGDLIWTAVQTLATCIQWFNPFAWLASRALTLETERRCDNDTVSMLGIAPADYARALLDVLERKHQLHVVSALPGVRPVEITANRLERVMSMRQGSQPNRTRLAACVTVLGCLFVLPGARPAAQGDAKNGRGPATGEASTDEQNSVEQFAPLSPVVDGNSSPKIAWSKPADRNPNAAALRVDVQLWELPESDANRWMSKWASGDSDNRRVVITLTPELLEVAERELQQIKGSKRLSAPSLITRIGQEARIHVGQERPFVVAHNRVESGSGENKAVVFQPDVQVVNEGLTLTLTADILPGAREESDTDRYRIEYRLEHAKILSVTEFKVTVDEGSTNSERMVGVPSTTNLHMEAAFQIAEKQTLAISNKAFEKDGQPFVTVALLTVDDAEAKAAENLKGDGKALITVSGRVDETQRAKAAALLQELDIEYEFNEYFRVAPGDAYVANALIRHSIDQLDPERLPDAEGACVPFNVNQRSFDLCQVSSYSRSGSRVVLCGVKIRGADKISRADKIVLTAELGDDPYDFRLQQIRFEGKREDFTRNDH